MGEPLIAATVIDLPSHRCSATDAGKVVERAGFRVRAVPSAHEQIDRDERGVIFTSGTSSRPRGSDGIIVETAWRMTGWPRSWDRSRSTCSSCRSTAGTRHGACRGT